MVCKFNTTTERCVSLPACESGEGELGDLDPDPALAAVQDLDGLDLVADDDVGGGRDEVESERLGDKGEGARDAQVALDHLQVVVLGDQLHVEGARHVERVGDVAHDVPDLQGARVRKEGEPGEAGATREWPYLNDV